MATITNTLIERGMSSRGGWNAEQLKLLGLDLANLKKGWKLKVEGNEISQEDIDKFLSLKDAHIDKWKKKQRQKRSC